MNFSKIRKSSRRVLRRVKLLKRANLLKQAKLLRRVKVLNTWVSKVQSKLWKAITRRWTSLSCTRAPRVCENWKHYEYYPAPNGRIPLEQDWQSRGGSNAGAHDIRKPCCHSHHPRIANSIS